MFAPTRADDICDDAVITLIDNFVAVRNNNDERALSHPKCIVIVRGLSGSGKTTVARCVGLYAAGHGLEVCRLSSDDTVANQFGIRWDRPLLQVIDRDMLKRFRTAVRGRSDVVIVDDENIMPAEYEPYVAEVRGEHAKYVLSFGCDDVYNAFWLAYRGSRRQTDTEIIARVHQFQEANNGLEDVIEERGYTTNVWIRSHLLLKPRAFMNRAGTDGNHPPTEDDTENEMTSDS